MKKFVLYGGWGRWETVNGKMVIDCTVVGYYKIAESNELSDLHMNPHMEYREDGTWHYQRIDKRAYAKSLGLS